MSGLDGKISSLESCDNAMGLSARLPRFVEGEVYGMDLEASSQKDWPLPHQQKVFEQMLATAQDFAETPWQSLPIRPRWHRLIVGPTGVGKSRLVNVLASHLHWPVLHLSVANWVLVGASDRGGEQTWLTIARWICSIPRNVPAIIFVDELDKLSGGDGWTRFLRIELFSLLDGHVPPLSNSSSGDLGETSRISIPLVRAMLREKILIFGAGAFQELSESLAKAPIGFLDEANGREPEELTLASLTSAIPRELANRFSSRLLRLGKLEARDYATLIEAVAEKLPSDLAGYFRQIGGYRIAGAVQAIQGARFIEEILSEAIHASRNSAQNAKARNKPSGYSDEANPESGDAHEAPSSGSARLDALFEA